MTVSFWLILLAVLTWGLLHSILASLRIKAQTRQWFGSKTDLWYRFAYNIIAVITFLPILILPVFLDDEEIYRIPFPWVILTLLLQGLAIFALLKGIMQTGMTSFIGFRQLLFQEDTATPRMVTDGLYRYVRHPLYTAGLVFIWLIPVMTWNLLALNLGLTIYILIGTYFEERKLLAEFGDAYAGYRQVTPMLFPRLRSPSDRIE